MMMNQLDRTCKRASVLDHHLPVQLSLYAVMMNSEIHTRTFIITSVSETIREVPVTEPQPALEKNEPTTALRKKQDADEQTDEQINTRMASSRKAPDFANGGLIRSFIVKSIVFEAGGLLRRLKSFGFGFRTHYRPILNTFKVTKLTAIDLYTAVPKNETRIM